MQKTFAMIKPNAVRAGLVGRIIARYESARLSVVAIRFKQMTQADVEGFYAEHIGQPFFPNLVRFMTSGPSVQLVLAGENAVTKVRTINGATNPREAEPGTIRYDWATSTVENAVHSSDCLESAVREIDFWFKSEEIIEYKTRSQRAESVL
ncbi:MAG: nucleoside-diphosphate kinase [Fibromonadaceae bacterium]|jgi:nucleoside-diphosphate kinase|nr:nucleoside-diphosphate kinase [Fibromonadaceae bacterium]